MKNKQSSIDDFLDLSSLLTGFDKVDLQGTGLAEIYRKEVLGIIGAQITTEIEKAGTAIYRKYRNREKLMEEAVRSEILSHAILGPLAKNITSMWYLGVWNQMPQAWLDHTGIKQTAPSHVISADAYKESLVWRVIGSHPPGAKQPGYGTWSLPPKTR
ncbi:MAG: hypothetical protein IPL01_07020 [Acidobacteria bacterium]|nr:hypothetical protein [Acidobacteriota bacterium]